MTTLGIIGGTGWLGGALARPALDAGFVAPHDLWLSSRSGRTAGFERWAGVNFTTDNAALAAACDVIVLSVRPEQVAALDCDLSGKLIISVMARTTVATISAKFPGSRIIRTMPNTCAEQKLGFSPLFAGPGVTDGDLAIAKAFLLCSGKVTVVGHEDAVEYYTALTGAGPVFVAAFAKAMIDHAVAYGLSAHEADLAVRQLFLGAATSIAQGAQTPAEIVDETLAYGGTTTAGLKAMYAADLATPIGAALAGAAERARRL